MAEGAGLPMTRNVHGSNPIGRWRELQRVRTILGSLSFRLVFWVGLILLASIATWAYFNIRFQKEKAQDMVVTQLNRLGDTIRLGTRYAMMTNSREDIAQITRDIAKQRDIESIRIYNKNGQIKISSKKDEVDQYKDIKGAACHVCHKQTPPQQTASLKERTRLMLSPDGRRMLGVISPIYNEAGCSTDACHFHPEGTKILGLLDVVVSLETSDQEIQDYQKGIIGLTIFVFLLTSAIISLFLLRSVNRPIKDLIRGTRQIANGHYDYDVEVDRADEIGQLAFSFNKMREEIALKQEALNKQWTEYQELFEGVPCYITVQDRDLKIIKYNREFAKAFSPEEGDYCYKAYKGQAQRCEICAVLKTLEDGEPHFSEEEGVNKDGSKSYWMVRTSPIKNSKGEVIAAMEMSLDLTHVRFLEREARRSEHKYRLIFNTIPNPVFVLDGKTFKILDCNERVRDVYGFQKEELLGKPFLDFFEEDEREVNASRIKSCTIISRARQIRKNGEMFYVAVRTSSSEYLGREVFLLSISDITMRLLAEQQLIQASKMATLGEMATGVAHELNQPLSVIKTASSFLNRKVNKQEMIEREILETMTAEIDSQVDRAARIINHMREFGRKTEVIKEKVDVNEVLKKALEIFSQQLKLREIQVVMELDGKLPAILADSNRLEQIFINLLINARDAIENKWQKGEHREEIKKIMLRTFSSDDKVVIEVRDTGEGIKGSIMNKIFDPFFTTKGVGEGTGLGLSISYGIVQDYEGTIKVESQEGHGADFIIQFPVPKET
jgi:histidine kinase